LILNENQNQTCSKGSGTFGGWKYANLVRIALMQIELKFPKPSQQRLILIFEEHEQSTTVLRC
ncbi:MAG: hypothetical protein WAW93_06885, partial [Streptococcus suis]